MAWWLLLLSGCAQTVSTGRFADDAFYLSQDHYRVFYGGPSPHVVSADWTVENFQIEDGVPRRAKVTPDYMRRIGIDENDDGRIDQSVPISRFDLRMSHRRDGSVLWSQTMPIPSRQANRDLAVVAHDFVDRVGGGSYFEVDWAAETVRERRVGTVIRREGPVRVDGVDAYWVTFDIISIDQREVDGGHQGERVTVVLAHPLARWLPGSSPMTTRADEGMPMLVAFGLAARNEVHSARLGDFETFLSQVDFHETN